MMDGQPRPLPKGDASHQRKVLEAFSRGEIGTQAVMAELDLDYGAVLDRLREEGLPRFRVPEPMAQAMAEEFIAIVNAAKR